MIFTIKSIPYIIYFVAKIFDTPLVGSFVMMFNGGIYFRIVRTEEVDNGVIIWKDGDIGQLSLVPIFEFGVYKG